MKIQYILIIAFLLLTGCSKDDNAEEGFVGNKYAHLFFETREECESFQELYFMNCAQILEVINDSQVEIMLTDIVYKANFYTKDEKLIVESSPDTYEFDEDLIFEITENGDLKLGEQNWLKYEDSFHELYDDL